MKTEIVIRIILLVAILAGGIYLLNYLQGLNAGGVVGRDQTFLSPFPSSPEPTSVLFSGPGGCTTLEECVLFCRNNPSLCFTLQPTPSSSSPAPHGTPTPTSRTLLPSISLPTLTPPTLLPTSPNQGIVDVEPTAEELAALEEFSRTLNLELDKPLEQPGPNGCRTTRQCQDFCTAHPSLCQEWLFANFPAP